MRTFVIAALTAAAIATSAGAVTTVTSVAGPDGVGETVLFNFNSGVPAGLTGNYTIATGSTPGQHSAPLGDLTPYLAIPGEGTSGSATLNLGGAYSNISFYWGSIDTYNNVTFYSGAGGTGSSLGTFAGNMIPGATADGQQGTTANNRRVFFTFNGPTASSVVFTSTNIAFELDDIATSAGVPEPAIWATLITGFALVGFSLRQRRQSVVAA